MDDELLERRPLLAAAHRAIAAACAGDGRVLVFEGPAGIGKSTLLDAVARRAGGAVTVARASPTELERGSAFGVVRELLWPLLTSRRHLFQGPAAAARRVFEPDRSPAVATALYGLWWLLGDLASAQPLVLVVDDAHWADEPSLAWFGYVAARLGGLPVALIAATRPPPASASALSALLSTSRCVDVQPVPPLSAAAVESIVGRSHMTAHADAALRATGGNPFLLRELLRGWARQPEAAEPVTTTVLRRAVAQRAADTGEEGVRFAEAVAVLGGARVELRHAAALAGVTLRRAADLAAALTDAQVLRGELPLAYVHPLVRDAIYDGIPEPRRAVAHRAAARVLDDDDDGVAAHLLLALAAGDPWCVGRLREAARRALDRGAPERAVELLRRALCEPPAPCVLAGVLHELGAVEARVGAPAAQDHLRAALDRATGQEAVEVAITLGRALMAAGRGPEAARVFEQALAGAGDDAELALRIEGELFGAARIGPGVVTAPMRSPAHAHAELRGDTAGERMLLASLAARAAASGTSAAVIESLAVRALGEGRLLRETSPETQLVLFLGAALGQIDRFTLALAHFDDLLAAARRCGSAFGYALTRAWRADTLVRCGELTEAEADALDALALATEHDLRLVNPLALSALTAARVELGRLDEAETGLASAGLAGAIPEAGLFAGVQHARGRLHLASGQYEQALGDLLAAGKTLLRSDFTSPAQFPWRSDAAVALACLGRMSEARRLAAEETRLSRRLGADRALGVALRARALVGASAQRVLRLEAAAERLRVAPAPVERGRTLLDLGLARLREGDREAGRGALREALDLAERHRAGHLAARAHAELLVAGARPRRRRLTGLDALTAGELRVARLAAVGRSNREIAAELFLTPKTIETHLGHVYAKLSISGRSELAAALELA